ncbi:Uu.00g140820.m01.CDS01 [Anthostomella pinea]|uniref:Uu.00g140820.m01.CDS01 n=1 Tax=Anthostomella pinea TaxID=933095 RepID=A0AAI8VQ42_9PEZI|nr:Uu.00g140820.m01.CDS01 [Anthostomella pinea]
MASTAVPIVQYGVENKNIPGDPTCWKMKECGNICHWADQSRREDFPPFGNTDFEMSDDPRIASIRQFLSNLANIENMMHEHGTVIRDTAKEFIIDSVVNTFGVRLIKLHDVSFKDKASYKKAARSKQVEKLSKAKMADKEPPMGCIVEDFLMAQRLSRGEAPTMPMHRPSTENPQGAENCKKWYSEMRRESCRTFWVKTTRQERDSMRAGAQQPSADLIPLIQQIRNEDRSHTKDHFWSYQRDELAAEDPNIYEQVDKDIVIVLDKDNELLLCKFAGLFRLLFGEYEVSKLQEALRKWASLPALPIPETARHMVDDFIRDTKHPKMDLEKATTLEEVEQRQSCVAHYGTWAMKGHLNPDAVTLTPDTNLYYGRPRKLFQDYVFELMPTFKENVLGLGSEVVRFLLSAMAPDEYQECCDVFKGIPDVRKMKMSEPTFATLAVLGINTYTQRHVDNNDVEFVFAGLLALGNYTGANICFPQLGIEMPYQTGDAVILRGTEMEHFVRDWTGYRMFLLDTNHRPVRRYAHRVMGKLPPKPRDSWHPDRIKERLEGRKRERIPTSTTRSGLYSPCWVESASPEPEELYESDVHGAGYLGRYHDSDESSYERSGGSSDDDKGELLVPLPAASGDPMVLG